MPTLAGCCLPSAVAAPRGGCACGPRLAGELLLGLLAGVVGGWVAGLVRVP
jgi:hypothetical protein